MRTAAPAQRVTVPRYLVDGEVCDAPSRSRCRSNIMAQGGSNLGPGMGAGRHKAIGLSDIAAHLETCGRCREGRSLGRDS